jgi:hypothetical protein
MFLSIQVVNDFSTVYVAELLNHSGEPKDQLSLFL